MEDVITVLYGVTQLLIFFFYIPHLRSVIDSETADAINVPAQFSFFAIGIVTAIYMWVINADLMATVIICAHILIGNLGLGLIAYYKQRKWRERRKKASDPERPPEGKKENIQTYGATRKNDPLAKRQTVSQGNCKVVRKGDPLHLQGVSFDGTPHLDREETRS